MKNPSACSLSLAKVERFAIHIQIFINRPVPPKASVLLTIWVPISGLYYLILVHLQAVLAEHQAMGLSIGIEMASEGLNIHLRNLG